MCPRIALLPVIRVVIPDVIRAHIELLGREAAGKQHCKDECCQSVHDSGFLCAAKVRNLFVTGECDRHDLSVRIRKAGLQPLSENNLLFSSKDKELSLSNWLVNHSFYINLQTAVSP